MSVFHVRHDDHRSGLVVSGYQQLEVARGGTVRDTLLIHGGSASIGGVARDTTLTGGTLTLRSHGMTTGTVISAGGSEIVSGGTAIATTISAGGHETVVLGVASESLILSGGIELVMSGGSADSATVASGGTLVVLSGTARHTTVESGGQVLSNRGVVVISGGALAAAAAHTLYGGTYEDQEYVFKGGTAVGANFAYGGTQEVLSGGVATGAVLSNGAAQTVHDGGRAIATSFGYYGYSSGVETVLSGGATTGTVMQYGGTEIVSSGGIASATTIGYFGGNLVVDGGTAVATIASGGYISVSAGGTLSGAYVHSGNILIASGSAVGVQIAAGYFSIENGTATDTKLAIEARQYVGSNATVIGTTIVSGSEQDIRRGGLALSDLVQSGGYVTVSRGAATSGTDLRGGTETLTDARYADATVIESGGVLRLYNTPIDDTVIQAGGTIDLAAFTYHSGGTATLNSVTDVLTVTIGSVSSALHLSGTYAADIFGVASDGQFGTLVTVSSSAGMPAWVHGSVDDRLADVSRALDFLTHPA